MSSCGIQGHNDQWFGRFHCCASANSKIYMPSWISPNLFISWPSYDIKVVFLGMAIPIIRMKLSIDCLMFITGTLMLVGWCFFKRKMSFYIPSEFIYQRYVFFLKNLYYLYIWLLDLIRRLRLHENLWNPNIKIYQKVDSCGKTMKLEVIFKSFHAIKWFVIFV